jgi:butyryl-CoA dehydrogenase
LTEDQARIQQLTRRIAREVVAPKAAQWDKTGEYPWEVMKSLTDHNLMGLYLPKEYGGYGGGIMELVLVVEELSRACSGVAVTYAANALATFPILLFGTEEQKKRYLTPVARGEMMAAFGLTEPNAGSDAGGIETIAKPDGDGFVLNGAKQWITNGGEAGVYTIFAVSEKGKGARGITAYIIEKDSPGFTFGKKENKLGIRCSATRELHFADVRIPMENRLGREGMGFMVAMKTLDRARPGVAAQALGIAQGALDIVMDYVAQKQAAGQTITSSQHIQRRLANMATLVESTRSLVYCTSKMIDAGEKNFSKESAMSKFYAADTAMQVTTEAMDILGTDGLTDRSSLEKMFRDAKITQIYEGTNEIQRGVIALEMIKEMKRK